MHVRRIGASLVAVFAIARSAEPRWRAPPSRPETVIGAILPQTGDLAQTGALPSACQQLAAD